VVIKNAKIPILQLDIFMNNIKIKCDISVNNDHGIRNSYLLKQLCDQDERVAKLVSVVKRMAMNLGINDASKSTLNSYSWVLLVVHFLQSGLENPVLPKTPDFLVIPELKSCELGSLASVGSRLEKSDFKAKNSMSIGELFYQWLVYYTLSFNFDDFAISIKDDAVYSKRGKEVIESLALRDGQTVDMALDTKKPSETETEKPLDVKYSDIQYTETLDDIEALVSEKIEASKKPKSNKLAVLHLTPTFEAQQKLIKSHARVLPGKPWFEKNIHKNPICIIEPLEGYNTARAVKNNGKNIIDELEHCMGKICDLNFQDFNLSKLDEICKLRLVSQKQEQGEKKREKNKTRKEQQEERKKVKKEKQEAKAQAKFDANSEKRKVQNEKKAENKDENGVAKEIRGPKEKKAPRDNRLTKDNFADKGDPVAKKKKLLSNIVEFQTDSRRRSNATDAEDDSSSEFSEIELSAKKSVSKGGKKRAEKVDKLDDEKHGHQLNDQTKKIRKLQDENTKLRKDNKKLQQDFITFKNKTNKNLDQKIKLIKKLQAELEEQNLKNVKNSGKTQFETEFKTVLNQN